MEKGKIVILSGGLDSTVLLNVLKHRNTEMSLYGLSFNYDQKHKKELTYAKEWGLKLCNEWRLVDLNFMKDFSKNSALSNEEVPIPEDNYNHINQKLTVIPNRNMIMLSIAVAWAESLGVRSVYYGAHKNDRVIYPDCRSEFVEAISKASVLGTYTKVAIYAPFVNTLKSDIVNYGARLDIDFKKTWSCYNGRKKHCGRCGTCQERKEAFINSKIEDPTEYEDG